MLSTSDLPESLDGLRDAAREARSFNYARYSGFVVAAVETTDGRIYGGTNVEVVNYSLSKHAEELAILGAIRDGALSRCGDRWLKTLYVEEAPPCGSCRQFAWEWAADDALCIVDREEGGPLAQPLEEILPGAFGPEALKDRRKS